ncbi:hypothetical protein F4781DRAFT_383432 [Annulohypoxylon bovei var. microspora]|nr:hypothetical protein F4781DRAFT_383432 [Annulohypoxylon bovei var. microspora]
MVSRNIIAVLGLASTAAATYSPQALKNLRDLRAEHVVIEVREAMPQATSTSSSDSDSDTQCASSAEAIITDAPTPPADLESYFVSFAATADLSNPSILCQITAGVPSSLSAEYSSYDQQASSWFSKHSSDIAGLVSKCAGEEDAASVAQVVTALSAYAADGCSGSVSKARAARPTGMIAGAVAAAGVLGAAAVL